MVAGRSDKYRDWSAKMRVVNERMMVDALGHFDRGVFRVKSSPESEQLSSERPISLYVVSAAMVAIRKFECSLRFCLKTVLR